MSRNLRTWTKKTSALAHAAKARKRMEQPVDFVERPQPGLLLKTIRVTDELQGCSFEVKVRQGVRLNQIIAETFGRKSECHGISGPRLADGEARCVGSDREKGPVR